MLWVPVSRPNTDKVDETRALWNQTECISTSLQRMVCLTGRRCRKHVSRDDRTTVRWTALNTTSHPSRNKV
uniref:Uncharacterized protein n=1 Tax=Ixodes ricinus TaxID=34613 RepID=A0A0K8R6X7_IXORI